MTPANPFHMTAKQIAAKQAAINAETARIAALPATTREAMRNVRHWHACDNAYEVIAESEATIPIG